MRVWFLTGWVTTLEAADFGRRRVGDAVIDARRNLSGVCGRWYPVVLDLHRFFIAIARAVVDLDGNDGTAPDPLVWSAGALPKRRWLVHAVRDRAMLPWPPAIWESDWISVPASVISADDVAHWHFSTGLLVKWVAFLGTLHWPAGGMDLGVGGISYVEMLVLCELWAGERAPNFGVGWTVWSRHTCLALLSFHCCCDEVTLFATWWAR